MAASKPVAWRQSYLSARHASTQSWSRLRHASLADWNVSFASSLQPLNVCFASSRHELAVARLGAATASSVSETTATYAIRLRLCIEILLRGLGTRLDGRGE